MEPNDSKGISFLYQEHGGPSTRSGGGVPRVLTSPFPFDKSTGKGWTHWGVRVDTLGSQGGTPGPITPVRCPRYVGPGLWDCPSLSFSKPSTLSFLN